MELEAQSLLGIGARYEGKLSFEGTARIDGTFEGEVFSEGCLIIGPEARVRGVLHVRSLIVLGGMLEGRANASESIEIHRSAAVEADLHAPKLYVENGAHFEGRCTMKTTVETESFEAVVALADGEVSDAKMAAS